VPSILKELIMDNRIKYFIAFPFVFVIILFIAANYIPLKGGISEAEERILAFMPSGIAIQEMTNTPVPGDIRSPMDFSTAPPSNFQTLERGTVPALQYQKNSLSMIVVSGKQKMAVIRGVIVREGDDLDGMTIAKIELDRVLLRDKTERWIYLEKTR